MVVSLPSVKFRRHRPELVDSVSVSRTGNRLVSVVEYADPFWRAEMQTVPLSYVELAAVEAFLAHVRNGERTVLYTPYHPRVPQAYWGSPSSAVLDNTGVVTAITDGFAVAFNSVDNGLVLTAGDLIGLEKDDYRSLHRVVTGGTASANALSVVVEPFVPGYITTGAVVRLKDPQLNCRVVPGSSRISEDVINPTASFTLIEVPK